MQSDYVVEHASDDEVWCVRSSRFTMGAEASKPGVAHAFVKLGKDGVAASDAAFWK